MYKPRPCAPLLLAITLTCTGTFAAQRTFVASTGLDTNPCSVTQPCRSFSTAIGATDAGGEIIVLDSGGYGTVVIAKSITITAPAGVYAGISVFGGEAIQVNGVGIAVVLRGLTINGIGAVSGAGIRFVLGARLDVHRCDIANLSGPGIDVQAPSALLFVTDTEMRGNDVGITTSVDASGTAIFAERIRIENSATDGIAITTPTNLTLRDASIARNANAGVNVFISAPPDAKKATFAIERLASTYNGNAGVLLTVQGKPVTIIEGSIANSLLADNGGDGVRATSNVPGAVANAFITISDSVIRGNALSGIDMRFGGAGVLNYAIATRNIISANHDSGIRVAGQTFLSRGDNAIYGNNGGGGVQTVGAIYTLPGI